MKVGESAGADRPARKEAPARRAFGDALRKASTAARADGSRAVEAPRGPRLATAGPARAAASRRAAADAADDALRARRDAFREEARIVEPPPAAAAAAARPSDGPSIPELRALVRTLPLAIQTFGLREGAPLALSFGRSLDVELRSAPRGLELVLRPEARLARAAEADLRGVVSALAAKGIAVSRAEVRPRTAAAPGAGPRVDVPAGLR